MLNILMVGDVVGASGRRAVAQLLPQLREEYSLDLVVVNAENADGLGLFINSAKELLQVGADILTLGDHIYDKMEIYHYLAQNDRIVRPLNFSPHTPGHYQSIVKVKGVRVMVVSVIGLLKINMYSASSPFAAMDELLNHLETVRTEEQPQIMLVDFHAEDIREKHALAWHLDGKVSAVVGTHTHVPTLDARILPQGTGKVTDLGMCGPRDSSLGMTLESALTRFVQGMPSMYQIAPGPVQFNSLFMKIDEESGRCLHLERVDRVLKNLERPESDEDLQPEEIRRL
ncbi:MAG: YmdB family metallophosphoesterase [Chloroflexi bacterium]|nr:YmdB family metallophosphoesterase [Chloroflexota bacterium]